jgi:hypothetical protein
MGLEARCEVEWQGQTREASVHLDGAQLEVRGRPILRVPFSAMRALAVHGATLTLELADGTLLLHLGAGVATRWSAKIRQPRGRLEKLGIRTGQRVCMLNFEASAAADRA